MVPYSAQYIFLSQVLIIYTYFHPKFHSSVFSIGSGSKTRPKEGYLTVLLCPPLCPFEPALPTSSLHWQSPDHTEQVFVEQQFENLRNGFGHSEMVYSTRNSLNASASTTEGVKTAMDRLLPW